MIEIREFVEPDMVIKYNGKTVCKINNELTLLDILIQIKEQQLSGFTISIPDCDIDNAIISPDGRFEAPGFVTAYEILLKKLAGF